MARKSKIDPTKQNSNEVNGILTDEELARLKSVLSPEQYQHLIANINAAMEADARNRSYQSDDYYIRTSEDSETDGIYYQSDPSLSYEEGSYYLEALGFGSSSADDLSQYGIINMPHQWNENADPRVDNWRGRAYLQHIMYNAPQVIFKMGRPNYMQMGKDARAGLATLMNMDNDFDRTGFIDQLYGDSENGTYYYTFEDDWENYVNYANAMIRFTAKAMGLSEYQSFNLDSLRQRSDSWFYDFFSDGLGLSHYLSFFVEASGTSESDSGSNSTTESQLASGLKNLGQTKRELDFLFGGDSRANQNADTTTDEYETWANNLKANYSNIAGIDNIMNKLAGAHTSIATGANLLFPEIWSDSQFRSNFSIEMKFHSPYGDKKSVFENIYLPVLLLLAMTLPRQSGKQGYTGPFIVQCWSKGWFTVNCGIIDSIDLKKGGSSGKEWNIDNLPTEIDVTVNIKDLYPTIMSTAVNEKLGSSGLAFANNIGLTEYLKTMAGIQLSDFNPQNNWYQTWNTFWNSIGDIPYRTYRKTQSTIGSIARKSITKIFGGLS